MASATSAPKRVLIVDDDPDLRALLVMGLELAGYRCVAAENGAAAMPLVQAQAFDVILLDLQMPVMDGLRFLEWLRQEVRNPAPVLVFTSVDADAEGREICDKVMAAGATGVLSKPARLPAILEKLGGLL